MERVRATCDDFKAKITANLSLALDHMCHRLPGNIT